MTQRLDYAQLSAPQFKKFMEFSNSLKDSTLEKKIQHLVDIRVSQINGCAFCVDMHIKQAKILGEREIRIHHLTVWRESPLFSARERACLAWAETVTSLPVHGISDDDYNNVRTELSDKEVTDLTFLVMAINGWNRMSIAMRAVPGSQDIAYGLDKAGLSDAA